MVEILPALPPMNYNNLNRGIGELDDYLLEIPVAIIAIVLVVSTIFLVATVALWVNKPLLNGSIRMYILMLDTRNVERTKYVLCTLKNIYSSRCSHIAVHG